MGTWRNKSMTLELSGFEELYDKCQKAGKDAEDEARKCFERCAEALYDELYLQAQSAGLSDRLLEEITEKIIELPHQNLWSYEVGWKKTRPSTENPIPDTYKVMFYNYGTPERKTKSGQSRGKEEAHPIGSHGFIKKAKIGARNKVKKIQKDTLDKIMKGLQK